MINLSTKPIQLTLTTPFRISRSVEHIASNIVAELTYQGYTGYGEAAPSEYYGENATTVTSMLHIFADHLGDNPFLHEDILNNLDKLISQHPSAKAAIDMALYDLVGKILNIPVYQLLGLNPAKSASTSFTIGIDTPTEMARKAQLASAYPILKIKVGTKQDIEILKAIRDVSSAIIRVDANAGWTPKEAISNIEALAPYNIEFIEQPLSPYDLAGLKMVREHSPLPIIADESCVSIHDIPRLSECVDGINLKLMKHGGVHNTLKMIRTAKAHNMLVMLGCMIESSLAITAAAHLTPLVDYADLDGHLLISNDPYLGVQVQQGKLILPDGPGLGVIPRTIS